MLKHTITGQGVIPADLKIFDSYTVSKHDFKKELKKIHDFHPKSEVWNRGYCGMCLEWAVHSFLYKIGLWRERTKDVDINYPQSFWEKFFYPILGFLVWPFIK